MPGSKMAMQLLEGPTQEEPGLLGQLLPTQIPLGYKPAEYSAQPPDVAGQTTGEVVFGGTGFHDPTVAGVAGAGICANGSLIGDDSLHWPVVPGRKPPGAFAGPP